MLLQTLPMLLVPAGALALCGRQTTMRDWIAILCLYGIGRLCVLVDAAVLQDDRCRRRACADAPGLRRGGCLARMALHPSAPDSVRVGGHAPEHVFIDLRLKRQVHMCDAGNMPVLGVGQRRSGCRKNDVVAVAVVANKEFAP